MKPLPQPLAAVFFDLDGTLADSARDIHDALATLCGEHGIAVPAFEHVREIVSRGARAILRSAVGNDEAAVEALLPRLLELYAATGMAHTHVFPGVDALVRKLEAHGVRWGVVSNKNAALVGLVMEKLGYASRAAAMVGGDTLPQRKPDPAPLLHACRLAGVEPARCAYVGDDPRDIVAGRAAGMYTVAAAWGYLDGADPAGWQPDAIADAAEDISAWLDHA
ncbi:MAG: Phosphoglycolate phosphatase [Rhodanobacteraceae bacterium]|jgi:phosphoglycolate phosphatase|nr:MAG: Phosphoglycolate phosphatase [Rhodanobacteraceae bacterium]